jgi:predicted metal-dependent hydrolase
MAFLESNIGWARKNLDRVRRIERRHRTTLSNLGPISRAGARTVLVARLNELAQEHGFAYNKVFIRNQKTRWGSCSENDNINLNVNLVRLRPGLMDYVILHELVHTRTKNHSGQFWSQLDKLVGNAKTLDRELRKHVLGLAVY